MIQSLKKKLKPARRRTISVGSSIGDLQDRVVMLCEDLPSESDSGRGSQSPGARSSGYSHSGDPESSWASSHSAHSARGPQALRDGERPVSPIHRGRHLSLEETNMRDMAVHRTAEDSYPVFSTLRIKQVYGST